MPKTIKGINKNQKLWLPFLNMETISGLPQEIVVSLLLNTESNSTVFSFQP